MDLPDNNEDFAGRLLHQGEYQIFHMTISSGRRIVNKEKTTVLCFRDILDSEQ